MAAEVFEDRTLLSALTPFEPVIVTGADSVGSPRVKVFNAGDLTQPRMDFLAFDLGFSGGVRVAAGDINGDHVPDIVAVAGPSVNPHVRVFDGSTSVPTLMCDFLAYSSFQGGVYVAVGDVNNDGFGDVITSPGAGGGPHVKVFSGQDIANNVASISAMYDILAYEPTYAGGVHVAAGDFNNDGYTDIVTAQESGTSPQGTDCAS